MSKVRGFRPEVSVEAAANYLGNRDLQDPSQFQQVLKSRWAEIANPAVKRFAMNLPPLRGEVQYDSGNRYLVFSKWPFKALLDSIDSNTLSDDVISCRFVCAPASRYLELIASNPAKTFIAWFGGLHIGFPHTRLGSFSESTRWRVRFTKYEGTPWEDCVELFEDDCGNKLVMDAFGQRFGWLRLDNSDAVTLYTKDFGTVLDEISAFSFPPEYDKKVTTIPDPEWETANPSNFPDTTPDYDLLLARGLALWRTREAAEREKVEVELNDIDSTLTPREMRDVVVALQRYSAGHAWDALRVCQSRELDYYLSSPSFHSIQVTEGWSDEGELEVAVRARYDEIPNWKKDGKSWDEVWCECEVCDGNGQPIAVLKRREGRTAFEYIVRL
ncbi:MAG: hypothetical protein U0795_19345 [Pirellulales bacterium]